MPVFAFGIQVKIENPWIDLQAENSAGDPVISAHCKLNVTGIKGKDFDMVAIIKGEDGEWHTDEAGNTVKTHYKCNATYEDSHWKDLQVFIPFDRLAPKPGKHTYIVYLYVYYNNEWYGGTLAGTFTHNNICSSRRNSSDSNSHGRTADCGVCKGSGIITCLLCNGMGGSNQYRCLTYPPYSSYYEWVPCIACRGGGKVACTWCGGTGTVNISY